MDMMYWDSFKDDPLFPEVLQVCGDLDIVDLDSSKDDPMILDVLHECDDSLLLSEEPIVPSVTPGTSPVHRGSMEDDDSSRDQDEPVPIDPPMPSLEDPPGAVVPMASMTKKKHSKRLGVDKKPTNRKQEKYPTKAKSDVVKPNPKRKVPPSKQTKNQTKKKKNDTSLEIQVLMTGTGIQHVYLGRGAPFRENPGNIRFRCIVDKYYGAYKLASKNALKTAIIKMIETEVKSDGSKFFVVETKGNVSHIPAHDKKIIPTTRRVLLDTPKRRADLWSWEDPADEQPSWKEFLNKDGEKLELMFEKDEDNRTKVDVTIREEKHRVDVSLLIIYRVDADGNIAETNLRVLRLDPDKVTDHGGESISESFENDVQQDDGTIGSFDLLMSSLMIPDAPGDAPGAPMQNSDLNPFSNDPRLSHAAPAPMRTMLRYGMPDVVRAKNLIKTKHEKKHEVKAEAGRVCWSWADPANAPLLCSNYPSRDGEQLSWSDFSNEDGAALERMYQANPLSRGEVDVTVREERHLVDVALMVMHRAEPDVNNITYLRVRRCPPDEEMDGREPICVSGDSDGQNDTSSSSKSSGSQSSGASGTSIRSCSQPGDGGGGGQSNLYWSLGMAQRSKDECSLFAFEASDEDVLEEIKAALVEEQGNDGRSTIGVRRPGMVKRLKNMFRSHIGISFGKKKDPSEADPVSLGKKKAPTEKAEQNLEILREKAIWLWRETKTRMSRHSAEVIVGDPKDCWVRYDEESSALLEASYQAQNGIGECSPNSKYTVDFGLMQQTNVSTRFQREVLRLESTSFKHAAKRSMADTARKLDPIKGHEADDMTAHTSTAETTSMGLDDTLAFYRHKCRLKSANTSKKSGHH